MKIITTVSNYLIATLASICYCTFKWLKDQQNLAFISIQVTL